MSLPYPLSFYPLPDGLLPALVLLVDSFALVLLVESFALVLPVDSFALGAFSVVFFCLSAGLVCFSTCLVCLVV